MSVRKMMMVLFAIVLLFVVYSGSTDWQSTGSWSTSSPLSAITGGNLEGMSHIYHVPYTELPTGEWAVGVPSSVIVPDLTNTYSMGGGLRESCDLCPAEAICPECPQYQMTPMV